MFSNLEISLIKSSLTTKTDEELAELLECPVQQVHDYINELTDGNASDRQSDVLKYRAEKAAEREQKRAKSSGLAAALREKKKAEKQAQKLRERKESEAQKEQRLKKQGKAKAADISRQIQQNRAAAADRERNRVYKTRTIDYLRLISIRLDEKTWAQIEVQDTPEKTQALIDQTRATYEANKTLNKIKNNILE